MKAAYDSDYIPLLAAFQRVLTRDPLPGPRRERTMYAAFDEEPATAPRGSKVIV